MILLVLLLSQFISPASATGFDFLNIEKEKKPAIGTTKEHEMFFQDKEWSWDIKGYGTLKATSKYASEPIAQPNILQVYAECTEGKKKVYYPIVQDYKYCGMRSISPAGKILVVHFMDYNDKTQRCDKKRVDRMTLPEVCNQANKKTAKVRKKSTNNRRPASK